MTYNKIHIIICARDRPEKGCKKHILLHNLELA